MTHQCNLSRMSTDSPRAQDAKAYYTPRPIWHEIEKHGEKRVFGVICLCLHKGPRWAAVSKVTHYPQITKFP